MSFVVDCVLRLCIEFDSVPASYPRASLHLQQPLYAHLWLHAISTLKGLPARQVKSALLTYSDLWSYNSCTFIISISFHPMWIPKAAFALAKSSFVCLLLWCALVIPGLQVFQRCRQLGTRRLVGAPQGKHSRPGSLSERQSSMQSKYPLSARSHERLTRKLGNCSLFSEWVELLPRRYFF